MILFHKQYTNLFFLLGVKTISVVKQLPRLLRLLSEVAGDLIFHLTNL